MRSLPGEFSPVVAHAGAGGDAAVGDLDGASQPGEIPGSQSIDGKHRRSADLPCHGADNAGGLNAGLPENSRRQHRHRTELPEQLFPACHMAGCQYPAGSPGPQGIGGDGGIAQTGHQQSPFRGQQRPQALPEQGGFLRTGEGSFPDGIGFQGDIASRRFADGPGFLIVLPKKFRLNSCIYV